MKAYELLAIFTDATTTALRSFENMEKYMPEDEHSCDAAGDPEDVVRSLYQHLPDEWKDDGISEVFAGWYWHLKRQEVTNESEVAPRMYEDARRIFHYAHDLYQKVAEARNIAEKSV